MGNRCDGFISAGKLVREITHSESKDSLFLFLNVVHRSFHTHLGLINYLNVLCVLSLWVYSIMYTIAVLFTGILVYMYLLELLPINLNIDIRKQKCINKSIFLKVSELSDGKHI